VTAVLGLAAVAMAVLALWLLGSASDWKARALVAEKDVEQARASRDADFTARADEVYRRVAEREVLLAKIKELEDELDKLGDAASRRRRLAELGRVLPLVPDPHK
jgi:hypothetical protein